MRLTYSSALGGWAYVDETRQVLERVAATLSAWSPRIANGEGRAALPLTGRLAPMADAEPLEAPLFRRVLPAPADAGWAEGIAAVVGCSLVGRANPFRSIMGYVGVAKGGSGISLGRYLVTRDEFGDAPPRLTGNPLVKITAREHLDSFQGDLVPGDLLMLGPADLPEPLVDRLWQSDRPAGPARRQTAGGRSEALARRTRSPSALQQARLARRPERRGPAAPLAGGS